MYIERTRLKNTDTKKGKKREKEMDIERTRLKDTDTRKREKNGELFVIPQSQVVYLGDKFSFRPLLSSRLHYSYF